MATLSWRLRRALSLSPTLLSRSATTATVSTPLHHTIPFLPPPPLTTPPTPTLTPSRLLHSTPTLSLSSAQRNQFTGDFDKIDENTILFEGCDYNHFLIVMDFPRDNPPSREEMIETYIQTAAKVVGSVEEAKKRIYALSTTTYTGFQVEVDEETSKKFEGLPGVIFVLPDSYIDPVNKEYGGDKYINGEIIPRPPPITYGRQRHREPRPRGPSQFQSGSTHGDGRNYGPQQNYPSQHNYGPPQHQISQPNFRQQGPMQGGERNNFPPQNNPPRQNFGPNQPYESRQNYVPNQPYESRQNYGPNRPYDSQQNFDPNQPHVSQRNYGPSQSYPTQQHYSPPGQRDGRSSMINKDHPAAGGNYQGSVPSPNYSQSNFYGQERPYPVGNQMDHGPHRNFPGGSQTYSQNPPPSGGHGHGGAGQFGPSSGGYGPDYRSPGVNQGFANQSVEHAEYQQGQQRSYPPTGQTDMNQAKY